MRLSLTAPLVLLILLTLGCWAASIDTASLGAALATAAQDFDGRVGACVQAGQQTACIRGDERFSLQSVMKLIVGAAVLDSVDHQQRRLDDPVSSGARISACTCSR